MIVVRGHIDLSEGDLLGSYSLAYGERNLPVWNDGALIKAMRAGEVLDIRHFHLIPEGSQHLIYRAQAGHPITLPTGEIVEASEGFRVEITP